MRYSGTDSPILSPQGMEDATEHLPSGDFKRLNTMLNWMRVDDMVYIESWEDIRL